MQYFGNQQYKILNRMPDTIGIWCVVETMEGFAPVPCHFEHTQCLLKGWVNRLVWGVMIQVNAPELLEIAHQMGVNGFVVPFPLRKVVPEKRCLRGSPFRYGRPGAEENDRTVRRATHASSP
jgi:hypothetical protein